MTYADGSRADFTADEIRAANEATDRRVANQPKPRPLQQFVRFLLSLFRR